MTHQAKRPYAGSQPSITSYFPTSVSSPNGQYNITSTTSTSPNEVSFPALPASVQSNLLNVGMRVRKSVPEGYKTNGYSAFALFAENAPAPSPTPTQKTVSKTRPRAGARELTPFCGILKIGGMATQAWGIYNPSGGLQPHDGSIYADDEMDEDEDEVPFLDNQGSYISNASVSRENKRRFFDDEEGDDSDERKSYSSRGLGERVIAVPRRKTWGSNGKFAAKGGQENVAVVGHDFDFEDAEFLDYGLDHREVEMSG
jgi:hypothetical protein